MRSKTTLIIVSAVAAILSGSNLDMSWAADPSLNGAVSASSAGLSVEAEGPKGSITLNDAIALALIKNPELSAFSIERRAAEARAIQSGLLPNPELSAVVENIGGAKEVTGGIQTTIQLSQLIEIGGKRSARARVASLSQDLAERDYERKRVEILTEVSKAFIRALSAQQKFALAGEMVALAEEVANTVSERVSAGKVSPIEETKARVALSSATVEHERAGLELEAARKRLSSLWGDKKPHFEKVAGDLDAQILPVPAFERIASQLTMNPDLVRSATEISRRKAAVDMEKAKTLPDISVSAGYRRFSEFDENSVIFGVSVPIPLFDRNQGGLLESRLLLTKAEEERRAAEARAQSGLGEAHKALSIAYAEAMAFKEKTLPLAQSAFEGTNEGYRAGKFGYLDILDAQRTLFDVRLQYLRALTEYHLAVADVEQLTGEPVITKRNAEQR